MQKESKTERTEMENAHLDAMSKGERLTALLSSSCRELRRRGLSELFQGVIPPQLRTRALTDPHCLDDSIEWLVKMGDRKGWSDDFSVQVGDYCCDAANVFELEFLTYVSLGLSRKMPFEQAWSRAQGMIRELFGVRHVIYELKPEDESENSLWIERICHHGVEPKKANEMARDMIALLKQIFLTRKAGFYELVQLEENDLRERAILLERLSVLGHVQDHCEQAELDPPETDSSN